MNWLITGGCGFLGTALINSLNSGNESHCIRVLDNLSTGSLADLEKVCTFQAADPGKLSFNKDHVEFIKGDILDAQLAIKVAAGSDVIVHFAANTGVGPSVEAPRKDMMSNVVGIFNYLEAARDQNVQRFIFASSGAPAGEIEPPIHEEIPPHPVSPYGASKLAGEGYCSAYKRTYGIDTVVLRFGNVYGPGSIHKNSVVAKFIRRAIEGKKLEIYGDGKQTRDFIYVDDLIKAVVLAVTASDAGGEIFQIASSKETTVMEIAEIIVQSFSARDIKNIEIINSVVRAGDVMRNYSDTTKAARVLGWKSETDLKLGINKTIDYFLGIKNKKL